MFEIIIINLKKHKKSFYNLSIEKKELKMLNLNFFFHLEEKVENFSIKINVYYILQWTEDEIKK